MMIHNIIHKTTSHEKSYLKVKQCVSMHDTFSQGKYELEFSFSYSDFYLENAMMQQKDIKKEFVYTKGEREVLVLTCSIEGLGPKPQAHHALGCLFLRRRHSHKNLLYYNISTLKPIYTHGMDLVE